MKRRPTGEPMPDEIAFEFGELRVLWDTEAIADYEGSEPKTAWTLEGSLAPAHTALRALAGRSADGSMLLLAAVRPAEAEAHGEEPIGATLIEPSGTVTAMDEALLSTEYSGDGAVRRITLELYREGDDYPIRGAGDTLSASAREDDGLRTESATLHFRLDGHEGVALYEIVHA